MNSSELMDKKQSSSELMDDKKPSDWGLFGTNQQPVISELMPNKSTAIKFNWFATSNEIVVVIQIGTDQHGDKYTLYLCHLLGKQYWISGVISCLNLKIESSVWQAQYWINIQSQYWISGVISCIDLTVEHVCHILIKMIGVIVCHI